MSNPLSQLKEAAPEALSQNSNLIVLVGNIIQVILGFLGIILVVLLVYAGFIWMTASGDSGKVQKAKDIIYQAVIGLLLTVGAYAISLFVINSLSP